MVQMFLLTPPKGAVRISVATACTPSQWSSAPVDVTLLGADMEDGARKSKDAVVVMVEIHTHTEKLACQTFLHQCLNSGVERRWSEYPCHAQPVYLLPTDSARVTAIMASHIKCSQLLIFAQLPSALPMI